MLIYLQIIETDEDKSTFEQIYEAYRGLMFHAAFKVLTHEQDAEDAVHYAFVKIAENIIKISEPVCPKTKSFVVTIVENSGAIMLLSAKYGNISGRGYFCLLNYMTAYCIAL